MNDPVFDGDDLVAMLDEILYSLIEALQGHDWVEAGRLDAAIRGIAAALGVESDWTPAFSPNHISYFPLLPAPSA
jgi:hypothetical protein